VKQFVRRTLRRFGVDIVRLRGRPDLMGFVKDRSIDLVIDVGANVGQFGERLRAQGYRNRIISFEPLISEFRTLARKAQADGNWEVNNCALGSASAIATINVSDSSTYSSILEMKDVATRHDAAAVSRRRETIQIRALDEFFSTFSGNVLLKIDTQGYEEQVLQGGPRVLSFVKGVLMELPIIHLYQGTWHFHEAIDYMTQSGFVPAQIYPVNYHVTDPQALLEVDCLFRPRDKRLDSEEIPERKDAR
jgi:FkbM family methyltransferase